LIWLLAAAERPKNLRDDNRIINTENVVCLVCATAIKIRVDNKEGFRDFCLVLPRYYFSNSTYFDDDAESAFQV